MKSKLVKPLLFIVQLAIAIGLAFGCWLLISAFFYSLGKATPEVTASIVGAMATILVGVFAVLISQAHERKRAAEEAHRLRKVEIYEGFIRMLSRMTGASNKNLSIKEPDQKELVQFLHRFKSDLLLWGSPKVIKAQIEFEAISGTADTKRLFRAVNNLYAAIREDIGLSNSGLHNLELVKLSLNDEARSELG